MQSIRRQDINILLNLGVPDAPYPVFREYLAVVLLALVKVLLAICAEKVVCSPRLEPGADGTAESTRTKSATPLLLHWQRLPFHL